jgi:hypothetical protein
MKVTRGAWTGIAVSTAMNAVIRSSSVSAVTALILRAVTNVNVKRVGPALIARTRWNALLCKSSTVLLAEPHTKVQGILRVWYPPIFLQILVTHAMHIGTATRATTAGVTIVSTSAEAMTVRPATKTSVVLTTATSGVIPS